MTNHIRSNLVAYLALFVALGGTGAWAATGPLAGRNTVNSAAIIDGQVKRVDIARGTLLRGPRGPKGARGLKGANGAQGPPGSNSSGGPPSGPAGGDLTGTYPNPTIGPSTIGPTEVALDVLTAADLAPASVGTSEVADDSLTGTDINESTLGAVPLATLGGVVRGAGGAAGLRCDPDTSAFRSCLTLSTSVPAKGRIMIVGQIRGTVEAGSTSGHGACRLKTTLTGLITDSEVSFSVIGAGAADTAPLNALTTAVGPGNISITIECSQTGAGAIEYGGAGIRLVEVTEG